MAALVGVIAHRCWDQIIGNLGAPAGDESPAREYPAADISTRPSRPAGHDAQRCDSSDIRGQRVPTPFKPSPRKPLGCARSLRADRQPGRVPAGTCVTDRTPHEVDVRPRLVPLICAQCTASGIQHLLSPCCRRWASGLDVTVSESCAKRDWLFDAAGNGVVPVARASSLGGSLVRGGYRDLRPRHHRAHGRQRPAPCTPNWSHCRAAT